jgi:hypothetical protein
MKLLRITSRYSRKALAIAFGGLATIGLSLAAAPQASASGTDGWVPCTGSYQYVAHTANIAWPYPVKISLRGLSSAGKWQYWSFAAPFYAEGNLDNNSITTEIWIPPTIGADMNVKCFVGTEVSAW